jgi:hypothetical protein
MTESSLLCLEMQHEPRVADFVELFAQILGRLLHAYIYTHCWKVVDVVSV